MERYSVLGERELGPVVERRVAEADRLMGEATRARLLGEFDLAIELLGRAVGVMDGEGEDWPGSSVTGVALAMGSPEVIWAVSAIIDSLGQVELDSGKLDTPKARRLDDLFSEQLAVEAQWQVDQLRRLRPRMETDGTWDAGYWEMAQERARTLAENQKRMVSEGVTVGPVSREERVRQTTRMKEKYGRPESRQERRARERAEAKADRRSRVNLVR